MRSIRRDQREAIDRTFGSIGDWLSGMFNWAQPDPPKNQPKPMEIKYFGDGSQGTWSGTASKEAFSKYPDIDFLGSNTWTAKKRLHPYDREALSQGLVDRDNFKPRYPRTDERTRFYYPE